MFSNLKSCSSIVFADGLKFFCGYVVFAVVEFSEPPEVVLVEDVDSPKEFASLGLDSFDLVLDVLGDVVLDCLDVFAVEVVEKLSVDWVCDEICEVRDFFVGGS